MQDIKKRMTDYWSRRAEGFSSLRLRELQGEKHDLWLAELKKYISMDRPLRILDLGTGTGFFAFLLAAQGHEVTGIDLTPDMIREAERTAEALGIEASFYVMDAEQPAFAPGSFDALVTRNLTWGLPHLAQAYEAWHDLLKPGGVLVNFDADYCREKEPETLPADHAHKSIAPGLMKEYEAFKEELRPGQKPRPVWTGRYGRGFTRSRMNFTIPRRFLHLRLLHRRNGYEYGHRIRAGEYRLLDEPGTGLFRGK